MEYKKLKDTWSGILPYNINGKNNGKINGRIKENYSGPVALSLPQWQDYVASGKNVLYGSGGVIPGGVEQTAGGLSGAVYAGHVRQGYNGWR